MTGVLLTFIGLTLAALALAPWPLAVDEFWLWAAIVAVAVAASIRLGFPVRRGGVFLPFQLAALGARRSVLNIGAHARVLGRALAADIVLRPALARARARTAGGAYARALAATPGVMPVDVSEGAALVHVLDETDANERAMNALDESMAPMGARAP